MIEKPSRKEDLIPAYTAIGEGDWAEAIRGLLVEYGVPLPGRVREVDLASREEQLGVRLPASLRLFLTDIGPVDLDGIRFFGPQEIRFAGPLWFEHHLSDNNRARLPRMLAIAESGSREPFVLDPDSGRCWLVSHDPPGFREGMESFDDLVKLGLIDLSWSYWGWPDPEVEEMARQARRDLFGGDIP